MNITNDKQSTAKFLNLILSQYNVAGYYLIFEAQNRDVVSIDSKQLLANIKRIIEAFQKHGWGDSGLFRCKFIGLLLQPLIILSGGQILKDVFSTAMS